MRAVTLGSVCVLLTAALAAAPVATAATTVDTVRVLVVYHSVTGNTQAMAEAVAEGARRVPGTVALVRSVDEVAGADLESADALLIGSPTYWGTIAAPVKKFIDDWLFEYRVFLGDRVGAAFATGGGDGGGKELVILSILTAMLNNGMIVVGPHYEMEGARFGGFGAAATTGPADPGVGEAELENARRLGERVTRVAGRFRAVP